MSSPTLLQAMRSASTWEELAAAVGSTVEEARTSVQALLTAKVPPSSGEVRVPGASVRIVRDGCGVPHVLGTSEADAYFGLGFAMGQDRLWQMDYLRRAADGTLAEILGPAGLENDRVSRTLGLRRVAEAGAAALSGEVRLALDSFCGGVNAARTLAERDGLPFEFDFLEYAPAPWTPADSLAGLRGFWWYLTGRFPVICLPEFARRILGDGPFLTEFMKPEGGSETIWPRGVPYPDGPRWEGGRLDGPPASAPGGVGSNNWVVGPSRSTTGLPMLASDPHVVFAQPNCWYEARMRGGDLDTCGAMAVGVPGIFFGRNRDVAWGLTNNISTLRDLYVEVTDDMDPSRYQRGTAWKGMESRREIIQVRGAEPVELVVKEVDHGPVVSEILPEFARGHETVSLRWVGHEATREVEAMLGYQRAASVAEFREHLRLWDCPTFNFHLADRSGQIAYQLTGKIPLRHIAERGYRPGEDPQHAWAGYVPFEGLPYTTEPPEGWLGSANNRVVTDDWPYPLSGTWPSDYRMQRLVQYLNQPGTISPEDMARGQMDEYSVRASKWSLAAVAALRESGIEDPLLSEIETWDHIYTVDSRAALAFETFFASWSKAVLTLRLPANLLPYSFPLAAGLVERLWVEDSIDWFPTPAERTAALRTAWSDGLAWLEERLGADRSAWRWGALHTVTLHHPLSTNALLRGLLTRGPYEHGGTWNTLNNSLYQPHKLFETFSGVSYRLLVDLAGKTQAVNPGGQSGHPGSPHYDDQMSMWQRGDYHPMELEADPQGDTWNLVPE